jgi:histone-lysine N-methyltransferase SETD7
VTAFGRFVDGEKFGPTWKRLEGGGFVVGIDDNNNNQVPAVYLYPDLTCAISGIFEGGKLKSGNFGKVSRVDTDDVGVPMPKVEVLCNDVTFTYDPSMSICISRSPLVRDPYEHQTVYVAKSKIEFAGEGLFAKRFIPAGTLVALFNGIRQRETGIMKKMTEFSDYRIGMGSGDVCLDIPNAYIGLDKYCATTGHKACHSFQPNSGFQEFAHPRFGRIMSIMAEVDIKSNEEVLVSYNYRIHQAPVWYQQLYFKHMREVEHVGEEGLYLITRRILRQHSVMIAIPPPARDSPRFQACGGCKLYHMRCTGINVDDIFDEDPAGNKVPKASSDWFSQSCTQPS